MSNIFTQLTPANYVTIATSIKWSPLASSHTNISTIKYKNDDPAFAGSFSFSNTYNFQQTTINTTAPAKNLFMKTLLRFKSISLALILMMSFCMQGLGQTTNWTGNVSNDWQIAGNWSNGIPAANYDVTFTGTYTTSITNVPTITLSSLITGPSANITLVPSIAGGSRVITLSNAGTALDIQSGGSLTLSALTGGTAKPIGIVFSGSGNTATIAGTLYLTFQAGGTNAGSSYNATNSTTTVTGIIKHEEPTQLLSASSIISTTSNLIFSSGGKYQHSFKTVAGTIPTATWDNNSTVEIIGYTTNTGAPVGLGQSFGHFNWNCTSQSANVQLAGNLTTVNGKFDLTSTGAGTNTLSLSAGTPYTLNIGGNMTITSGTLQLTTTSAVATLNISGNYSQTGGIVNLASGSSQTPTVLVNILGNFANSAGNNSFRKSDATGSGKLVFKKSNGTQTFSSNNISTLSSPVNIEIGTGATNNSVILNSSIAIHSSATFTVFSGSILDLGTNIITGGTFTLSSGGFIITANNGGLASSGATGSVQTTIRNFNNVANYEFQGTNTGIFTTSPTDPFVNNFTINRSGGVTLDKSYTVNGTLNLLSGILTTGANTITINPVGSVSRTSGHVNGNLKRTVSNGANVFDIGTSVYAPVTLTMSGVLGTVEVTGKATLGTSPNENNPTPNASGIDQTKKSDHYWTLITSGAGTFTSYTAAFDVSNTTNSGSVAAYKVSKFDASASTWSEPIGSASGNIVSGSFTSLSEFVVGESACTEPSITTGPTNATVTYGDNATFTVTAAGSPTLTYQWQVSTDNGGNWNNVSGGNYATNTSTGTLTITKPTVSMSGYKYKVIVSGACASTAESDGLETLQVDALSITGAFTADNKVYDGDADADVLTRSLVGDVAADDVSLDGGTATFNNKNVGNGKTVTLTGATLVGADAGNYTLSSVATTTANITALSITGAFTADNKIYDGDADADVLTRSLVGDVAADDVSLDGGTATFSDKNVGNGKTVTLTGATLVGADATNYTLTSVATTTANITALSITGAFTADNKVYDGDADADVLTRSLVGDVAADDVSLDGGTATFNNKNVGNGKTVTLTGATLVGADATNYTLTSVATTTANITALSITGAFTADNKVYDGDADADVLTRSLVGDVAADDVSLDGGTATFNNKNVGNGKTVTLTGATLVGADATNYTLTSVATTTANITALSITGAFTADNKVYDGDADADVLTRSLVGDVAADDVSLDGGTATFNNKNVGNGKTVTLTGATLVGADATNYTLTSVATTTANITALSITGAFTADNKVYDGDADADVLTRSLVGEVAADDVSLDGGTATFSDKNVGNGKTVTLTGATLVGADATNYTLTSVATTTANITALSITGAFTADNKVYDGDADADVLTRSLVGDVAADDVSLDGGTATFNNKNVGNGKTVTLTGATLVGADATNYTLTSVATTTANITALSITGAFTADNKIYDGDADADVLTRSLVGDVAADDVSLDGGTATFSDKNVGNGKTVTLTGATLVGADATNYTLTSVATTTANITALSITGAFTADNKVYDGDADADVLTRSLVGDVAADDVSLDGGTATFNNKNVGNGKTVTLTGATLVGADATNYTLTSVATTTANITALSITGAFTADNKVYDGDADADVLTRSLVGEVAADDVSLDGGTATFNNKNVGNGKTVTLTGATLVGADATNYTLTSVATTTANITALSITGAFTADNKVYDGDADADVLTRSLVGEVAADDVSLDGGTATFNNKNVGNGKTVTLTGATLVGADATNYTLTSVATTTANITALSITGAFTADNKVYDGDADADVLTRSLVGDVAADDVSLDGGTATFNNKNVGNGKTVTLTGATLVGADATNYTLTSVATTTANITALSITGAFTADNKVYDGDADADVLTRSLVGDVAADDVSLDGGTATFNNKNVGNGKTVTLTGATLVGADATNYTLTSVATTTANITALSITGAFTADNKIYDGDADADVLTRSLVGDVAADDVSLDGGTATFNNKNVGNGKTVTLTGATLVGADATNYTLTSVATITANITQRALTVSAIGINKVYDGNTNATVTLSTDKLSGDAVTAAYTSASFDNPNVGTGKAVSVSGISISGADAGNYSLTNTTANTTANITARPITITAHAKTKVYGTADPAFTYQVTSGSLAAGDVLNGSLTRVAGQEDVGTYPIQQGSVDNTNNPNYSITYIGNNLTITPQFAIPMSEAFYTGSCFFWTTSPTSSTATLNLSATLRNTINYSGNITTAKVSFFVRTGTYPNFVLTPIIGAQNLPVGLVNPGDLSVGTAATNVQYNIGNSTTTSLQIAVKISGNYSNNINNPGTDKMILIAVPVPGGQICGAGDLDATNSAGYVKGTSNITFSVKYNSSLKNSQGNVDAIIHSYFDKFGQPSLTEHVYRIKSNAISTFVVDKPAPNYAQFTGKANISEITGGIETSIEGNCTMQFSVYDNIATNDGEGDKMAITVHRAKGGIWFSSNWTGTKTDLKLLVAGSGNVAVKSNATTLAARTSVTEQIVAVDPKTSITPRDEIAASIKGNVVIEKLAVKVMPNPSPNHFTLLLSSGSNEKATIRVVDAAGRAVDQRLNVNANGTLQIGNSYRPGVYITEVKQGNDIVTLRLIKL